MLGAKKSLKKLKVGLISIGKNDKDIQAIKWQDGKDKEKFIKLCIELYEYFEDQADQSMRSTQKNIS